MKTPVLMVIPPSLFLLDERVFLSLGLLRVAASLEAAGHRIEMVDLSGIENFEEVIALHAAETESPYVCITATTPQLPAAVKIAKAVRRVAPHLKLIIGGPHVTLVHAAMKLDEKRALSGRAHRALEQLQQTFDVLVSGDGELAIFEALRMPSGIVDADQPKGLLFLTNKTYNETKWPARHLVDMSSYKYSIEGHRACSLIGQLGCPFKCSFCGGRNTAMLRRIRSRTTENIVAEIEALHCQYGFTGFNFFDDELNVNKGMVELMRAIRALQDRLGVEFRFRGFVKSELFNAEQAEAMYAAGFRWLLCGFEAADPRILVNIQKNATVEDNDAVIDVAHAHGLKVKALMSVGHAGESEQTVMAVRDWLISRAPDDFDTTVISTYPGTPYYDEAVPHESQPDVWTYTSPKTGDRLHAYDIDYSVIEDAYKGIPGEYTSYVFTDFLSRERLVELRNEVEDTVRAKLGIPFNAGAPGVKYDHSMGQGKLPEFILRRSA